MVQSRPHVQLTPRAPLPQGSRPPAHREPSATGPRRKQCRFTRNVTVIAIATGAATRTVPRQGITWVAARRAAAYAEPMQPAIAPAGRAAR